MIKKLLARWINPELQNRNQALILQINWLVEEKYKLLEENGEWGKLVVELEDQIIFLKNVHADDRKFLNWRISHLELTVDRLLKTRDPSFSTDK